MIIHDILLSFMRWLWDNIVHTKVKKNSLITVINIRFVQEQFLKNQISVQLYIFLFF